MAQTAKETLIITALDTTMPLKDFVESPGGEVFVAAIAGDEDSVDAQVDSLTSFMDGALTELYDRTSEDGRPRMLPATYVLFDYGAVGPRNVGRLTAENRPFTPLAYDQWPDTLAELAAISGATQVQMSAPPRTNS